MYLKLIWLIVSGKLRIEGKNQPNPLLRELGPVRHAGDPGNKNPSQWASIRN
ncbi:MAG TPA: hypothetical protein VGV09_15250 [Steroidobacteraceae bacterium]|nr:hypothetical protein [Steroidobacteraceae bacterium]